MGFFKEYLFHEIEPQIFFSDTTTYYHEFWKTKRDDFFSVRCLVCVYYSRCISVEIF